MGRPYLINVVGLDDFGPIHTASDDVWWYLPSLGPTTTLLLHRCAQYLEREGVGSQLTVTVVDLARMLGLGRSEAKVWTAIERADRHGVGKVLGANVFGVRLMLPALNGRDTRNLPTFMASDPALAGVMRQVHTL